KSAGHVIVGSSVSTTVTFCEHVAVLFEASVTVHVTTVVPTGNDAGASFVYVKSIQLSATTGAPKLTPVASHEPASAETSVKSAGHVIVGSSVSTTVTLNEHVAVLPAPSVAVYVTVVVPTRNTSPLLCELDNNTEQLSDAVGAVHSTTASHEPGS